MRFLKVLGVLLLLLACCIVVVLIMGSSLPRNHVASASIIIPAPQQKVWDTIEDISAQTTWRRSLKSVRPMPDQNGHRCWLENQQGMNMPLCEDAAAAPDMRVVRIADTTLPFGGTWNYVLTPIDAGNTRLTITENGTTGPAIWRFAGHYIFHEDTSIREYEADLQKFLAAH